MSIQGDLLREIEPFLQRHGMSQSRFGKDAVNDAKLIPRLRDGVSVTTRTIERTRAFMRAYKPAKRKAA